MTTRSKARSSESRALRPRVPSDLAREEWPLAILGHSWGARAMAG